MSTDLLRKAATLMRERATAATAGPWDAEWDQDKGIVTVFHPATNEAIFEDRLAPINDAVHIAGMHPAVALALANWLDWVAGNWNFPALPHDVCQYALAVARAYLGTEPDQ